MSDNHIKEITTDDLRRMGDQEGLILQGCGGLAQEWVDGINGLFTEAGILLNGNVFKAENSSTADSPICCSPSRGSSWT